MSDKEVVNYDSDIQVGEKEVDEHGRMIYTDTVIIPMNMRQLHLAWGTIKEVLELGVVPPDELGPVMELLERIAAMEKDVWEKKAISLPINYCVGFWHCLNTGRKFHIYKKEKAKDKQLDKLTMEVAKVIDNYHKVMKHEQKKTMQEIAMETSPKKLLE